MQFFTGFITLATLLATTTLGAPATTAAVPRPPTPNAGGVYYCTDANWLGSCNYQVISDYNCVVFNPGNTYYKTITAFGPDQGISCTIYAGVCSGRNLAITYPGAANLTEAEWNFNDQLTSFTCWHS